MSDTKYYPKNYEDSRRTFRQLAAHLPKPAVTGEWAIPSPTEQNLFVDHVWLPATVSPQSLFVITSGVHGAECYAGAAIQQMFMQEILPHVDRKHVGIFIAHAMNPYGFKHHQRNTEGAINLNRNFSVSGDMFKLINQESTRLNEKFIHISEPTRQAEI